MADVDLFAPLSSLQWVDRDQLKPNDYNPNKVNRENLKLLVQSILTNGWTLPWVQQSRAADQVLRHTPCPHTPGIAQDRAIQGVRAAYVFCPGRSHAEA